MTTAAAPDLLRAPIDAELRATLRAEAEAQRAQSDPIVLAEFGIDGDGALRGKRHVVAAGPGPALAALHRGAGLELARRAVDDGMPTFPTRASLLYYGAGDHAMLHHDVSQCTVTILMCLSGKADPLIAYPAFGRADEADVAALNAAPIDSRERFEQAVGERLGAERLRSFPIDISPDSLVALPGRDMPHARYPQPDPVMVAALCYGALAHRPAWRSDD